MQKEIRREGSPSAKLISLIREHGFNKEMSIEIGMVATVTPLTIHIESDNMTLDQDDLVVAEHLLKHDRVVSLVGGTVSGQVTNGNFLSSLNVTKATMTIESNLHIGDRVIVVGDNDTQLYFLIDKVGGNYGANT